MIGSTTIYSYDRNRFTGTVAFAVWTPQGRSFDGTDDYITLPNHSTLNMTTGITIMSWAKIDLYSSAANYDVLLDKETQYALASYDTTGVIGFYLNTAVGWVYTTAGQGIFTLAGFCHIAVTWDGANRCWYKNGALIKTLADSGTMSTGTKSIRVGALSDSGTLPFDGTVGEVLVYSRALTAGEIANYYLATKWRYV